MKTLLRAIVFLVLVQANAICVRATMYSVTDLGSLDGPSFAWGINNSGQVVGYYGSGPQYGFLYSNGAMSDIGTLGGQGGQTQALAINDSGEIAGVSDVNTADQHGVSHGFVSDNGTMTDLSTLPSGNNYISFAQAINDSGQVVGGWDVGGRRHPFLYSNGVMSDLGSMLGGTSVAFGINDSSKVVGYSYGQTGPHAFYYDGVMTDLGTLGRYGSVATAINNSGEVVGFTESGENSGGRAFSWTPAGGMVDLGVLPSTGESVAYAVNKFGQIVGDGGFSGVGAFLFENGVMEDLNTLIQPDTGWVLSEARGINDAGQIVGYGTNGSGQTDALLLTPVPESSTLLLAVAGMSMLIGHAWLKRHQRRGRFAGILPTNFTAR